MGFISLFGQQLSTTSNASNCAGKDMTSTKLLFIVALGLAVFAVAAMADGDYDDKHRDNKGPCKGGYWPDGKGCCPKIIQGKSYYRDGNKCYPKDVGCGVFYADGNGYYPDEKGKYPKAGDDECKCHQYCIRPEYDDDCHERSTTKKHHRTSTTEECPKETTTTRRETTSTKKHRTTSTTEECPKETTSTKKHYSTTSEKYDDKKKQCRGGQWSDDDGCCPRKIGHQWYYRDAHGCYPVERDCGVYYADGKGFYPDEQGKYAQAGEHCPDYRKCKPECDDGYGHY